MEDTEAKIDEPRPFFSVVIPTRNRPEYVVDAARSILDQSFEDFELIISDNSDARNAEENRNVLSEILRDPRCRYIRPPNELAMTVHWEWAVHQAAGQYVGFVTDRMALRLYALQGLHRLITSENPASVSFSSADVVEMPNYRSVRKDMRVLTGRAIDSTDKILQFSRGELSKDTPRMLNSFTRRDALANMNEVFGSVFDSICPDYNFTFRFLATQSKYFHCDSSLLIVQGESRSNGYAFKNNRANSDLKDFIRRMHDAQRAWLDYGPIPQDVSVFTNCILREYDIVSRERGAKRFPEIDREEFYKNAMGYSAKLAREGILREETRQTLEKYRKEHGLRAVNLPQSKSSLRLFKDAAVKGKVGGDRFRRGVSIARGSLESLMTMIGVGKRLHGKSLSELLHRDYLVKMETGRTARD